MANIAGEEHKCIESDAERIDFHRILSIEEGSRLRLGGHGDMDSKWSYFYKDGWLSIYRGSGQWWARLKLCDCAKSLEVEEAWVSRSRIR